MSFSTVSSVSSIFKRHAILFVCIFLACIVYSIGIETYPSGFHNDEASFFLNAQYIRDTGKDEDGLAWPVYLRSFIDPKPALYSYLQIPFTVVLGDMISAARAPSIAFGIGTVIAFYALVQLIFSTQLAKIATPVFALSPWMILLVRGTQEVVMSLFFGILSLSLFARWISKHSETKPRLLSSLVLITAFGSAFLSMYAYHSAKLVLPLLFVLLYLWNLWFHEKNTTRLLQLSSVQYKKLLHKTVFVFGILAVFTAFVYILTFSSADGLKRFQAVSVFSQPQVQLILDEQIRTATPHLPQTLIRAFHNKPVNYAIEIMERMSAYLSFEFLFFQGAQPMRYSVPRHGLLFMVEILFVLFGVIALILQKKSDSPQRGHGLLLLFWILFAIIPGSITSQEHPSMIRTAFLLPAISIVVAHGLLWILAIKPHKTRTFVLGCSILGYLLSMAYFANQYTVQAVYLQPWHRNLADQRLVETVQSIEHEYDEIVISRFVSGQPYVYFGLADLFDPQELQALSVDRTTGDYTINIYNFKSDACPVPELSPVQMQTKPAELANQAIQAEPTESPEPAKKTLYAIGGTCKVPVGYIVREQISYADGAEAYLLVEVDPEMANTAR